MKASELVNINKNKALWLISLSAAAFLLWLSLSNINFPKLVEIISDINYFVIILSLIPAFLSLITQTYRWQVTFNRLEEKTNFWDLFRSFSIGNALNNLLPKGGELIKPYIYSSRSGLKYSSVLATVGIDRFYDLVGLLLFMTLVLIFNKERLTEGLSVINPEFMLGALIVIGLSAFFILYKISASKHISGITHKIFVKFPKKTHLFLAEKFEYFRAGLESISSLELNMKLLLWTVISWLFHSLNLYIAFFAFDFQSEINLSYFDAVSLVIAISIGITVLPVPGGTGVQHYVVKILLMNLFGIEPEIAIAYASINHASIFFLNLINGIICIIPERKYLFTTKKR